MRGPDRTYLEGDDGSDVLTGGPNVDTFYGEDPTNASNGTTGRDQIFARDGNAEFVSCGPGIDAAQVDATDQVRNWAATDDQCETVEGGGAAGGAGGKTGGAGGGTRGTPGRSGGTAGGGFTVSAIASRPKGKIVLKLVLSGPGVVSIRAVARAGGRTVTVDHVVRKVSAAGPLGLAFTVSAARLRALAAHRKPKVTIQISFSPNGGGRAVTVSRAVLLRGGGRP